MTHGWPSESRSGFGQVGIGIQGCTLPDPELRLVSALESATLADLAGAGTTGTLTGGTALSFTTTTPMYPTVESSSIATASIGDARTSITPADFTVEIRGSMGPDRSMGLRLRNMGLPHHIPSPAIILVHSAVLTMAESPEDSPLAGNRVSAEDSAAVAASTVGEAFTVEAVIGEGGFHLQKALY